MWSIFHYYFALIITSYQMAWWIETSWRFQPIPVWFDRYFKISFVVLTVSIILYIFRHFSLSAWKVLKRNKFSKLLALTNLATISISLFTLHLIQINSIWLLILLLPAIAIYWSIFSCYIFLMIMIYQQLTQYKDERIDSRSS